MTGSTVTGATMNVAHLPVVGICKDVLDSLLMTQFLVVGDVLQLAHDLPKKNFHLELGISAFRSRKILSQKVNIRQLPA